MNKEMKRKLVFLTLLFFSFAILFAAPGPGFPERGHKNFHGKRIWEDASEFHLLFVEAKKFPGIYNFKFVFSQPVNPISLGNENFFLNGNEIHFEKTRFSKNYIVVDFLIDSEAVDLTEENNELIIKNLESINGIKLEPVVIKNFQADKEYKLMRKPER